MCSLTHNAQDLLGLLDCSHRLPMVTIGHINAIHGLQNVPHSGEEDGPRGRMRDGRGIEEGREGVKGEREGRRGGKKEKEGG